MIRQLENIIIAIDSRLCAFSDRKMKYYLADRYTIVELWIVMELQDDKCAAMKMVFTKQILCNYPELYAESAAKQLIVNWVEKFKVEKLFTELDVKWDEPMYHLREGVM